jgi:hypothetical protein
MLSLESVIRSLTSGWPRMMRGTLILRRMRQHRAVRGGAELLAEVVPYLGAMLVVILILDQLIRLAADGI